MEFNNWKRLDLFLDFEENPLKKYEYYFKAIDFNFEKCNYSFIIPAHLSVLFSSFYTKILKNSFIIFPKDFHENNEIMDYYKNELGKEIKWIIISPCVELEKNIKALHEKENIIYFIGYCPIFYHEHDDIYLYSFEKFYDIVYSAYDLIEQLFILSNVFDFRKKQNYEINYKLKILELKKEAKYFIEIKEETEKEPIDSEKFNNLFKSRNYKVLNYFTFIKSYNFLSKYLEEKNFNLLKNSVENLTDFFPMFQSFLPSIPGTFEIFKSDDQIIIITNILKHIHIVYFYFSNYPYLLNLLTDEEINQMFSKFKSSKDKNDLKIIAIKAFNGLISVINLLSLKINNGESILKEKDLLKKLQASTIEVCCYIELLSKKIYFEDIKYYQVKNYFRDIDFCLTLFIYCIFRYCNYPLINEIYSNLLRDLRFYLYLDYLLHYQKDNKTDETEQEKKLNEAIKYNDTLVIGDKKFHDFIAKIKLPYKNIYFIKENEILDFFQDDKKIKNKYKICKYIIIMNEKNCFEYLETIRYISNTFVLQIIIVLYIENRNINIDKKILQGYLIPIVLTYNENDILNYYIDHFKRLKEKYIKYIERQEFLEKVYGVDIKFYKIDTIKMHKEEDNGWDMKKDIDSNIFNIVKVEKIFGNFRGDILARNMYKLYLENNCLDLFINYYGNYFGVTNAVEISSNIIISSKLFLYAYTLEEKNGKSFYSLVNNDFRSGNPEKICRYLPIIKIMLDSIKANYLKSYSGDIYRATYFKQELIDAIKPGKKMINASFWSSSKKLSVAEKFLFSPQYTKNILLHAKVKKGCNVDIHLENLSQYPNEEEVLFLPYCNFEIQSFEKGKKKGHEYYILELIYCEDENSYNKIKNIQSHEFNI